MRVSRRFGTAMRISGACRETVDLDCKVAGLLLPAIAAELRNQVIAGASRVAAPPFAVDHMAIRRPTRVRDLRAVAMVVTGLTIRVATIRVGSAGMRHCGLRMRTGEQSGE